MGYNNPPYKQNTTVKEFELVENTTFVRVYNGDLSGKYGGWVMKYDDIKGLSPNQIKDKYALPTTPKYVVDVKLEKGTTLRAGITNRVSEWGSSGGLQFDLMNQRIVEFVNPRPLNN